MSVPDRPARAGGEQAPAPDRAARAGARRAPSPRPTARHTRPPGRAARRAAARRRLPGGLRRREGRRGRQSLRRKRGRAVARAWPALAIQLGAAFDERFDAYARVADAPASGDPLEDGLAFARSLDRPAASATTCASSCCSRAPRCAGAACSSAPPGCARRTRGCSSSRGCRGRRAAAELQRGPSRRGRVPSMTRRQQPRRLDAAALSSSAGSRSGSSPARMPTRRSCRGCRRRRWCGRPATIGCRTCGWAAITAVAPAASAARANARWRAVGARRARCPSGRSR